MLNLMRFLGTVISSAALVCLCANECESATVTAIDIQLDVVANGATNQANGSIIGQSVSTSVMNTTAIANALGRFDVSQIGNGMQVVATTDLSGEFVTSSLPTPSQSDAVLTFSVSFAEDSTLTYDRTFSGSDPSSAGPFTTISGFETDGSQTIESGFFQPGATIQISGNWQFTVARSGKTLRTVVPTVTAYDLGATDTFTFVSAVPEPSSTLLLVACSGVLILRRHRQHTRKQQANRTGSGGLATGVSLSIESILQVPRRQSHC